MASSEPLFAQIAASVRGAIARGELAVGEKLPTVRDLADSLGVHMHTVRAAYAELRDEGLVDMRRGRHVTVIATSGGQAELRERVRALIATARSLGLSDDDVLTLMKESL
ncbi:MAG: GntR family transcriptional regulator [Nocardioides sp.]|jgi:GntR family transcriptional regulator